MRVRFALLPLMAGLLLLTQDLAAFDYSNIYFFFGDTRQPENTGLTIFPTLIIPAGGEFEGMATAYTAVARDVSFFDANPAASATLSMTELTFTHNLWIAGTYIDGSTYAMRFDDLGIAFGGKILHVPFSRYGADTDEVAGGRYSEGVFGANISYNFLRDFYYPGLSVGATIKTAYRSIPEVVAPGQSAIGIAADVGVLTRFNFLKYYASRAPNFAAGITAKNFGPAIRGEPLPSQITTGVAYSPIRPLIIALDFIVPVSLARGVPAQQVAGAIGAAVQITPFFSAQTGFLFRLGDSRFTLGATVELTDVTIVTNYTLDRATQFDSVNRVSVQAQLNLGDRGRGEVSDTVDRLYLDAWVLSAGGELEQAVRLLSEALELDPTFTPATELLELTQRTLDLQEELRAIDLEGLGQATE
jgi:uncharacterized protein UPF0164